MVGENRVSITLSPETIQKVKEAVKVLEDNLQPLLVKISAAERRELPKMGDKTVAFVTKATEYAERNSNIVPAYIDVPELRKDIGTVESLRTIAGELEKLSDQLNDTMMLAGSEAYTAALAFYGAVKVAAKMNQPGAEVIYNELKQRFPKTSISVQTEPEVAK